MKNKLTVLSLALLALVIAMPAVAAENKPQVKKRGANYEAVQKAITNNDFTAWKEAVGPNNPMLSKVTADNFSKFVEAHNLQKAGKNTEAQKIFQELGITKSAKNMKEKRSDEKEKEGGYKKGNKFGPKIKTIK